MSGAERIARERARQTEKWTPEHDDAHADGILAFAAALLATPQGTMEPTSYPICRWVCDLWNRHSGDRVRQLEIAGALVAAEIDRLLREIDDANAYRAMRGGL